MFPFGPFVQVTGVLIDSELGDFSLVVFCLAQHDNVDPVGGPVNRCDDTEIQHVVYAEIQHVLYAAVDGDKSVPHMSYILAWLVLVHWLL